jgi:hypothetical protein
MGLGFDELLFPKSIIANTGINGECYLWGLLHKYKKKASIRAAVTLFTTTSEKRENHDTCSQVKSNEVK